MHIVINGWFAGQQSNGSGQYLDYLLPELARQASAAHISLFVPNWPVSQTGKTVHSFAHRSINHSINHTISDIPNIRVVTLSLPALPRQLAKLYWEQWMMPIWARRLQADVLWVPYWAAPWWQPRPTLVTVHDVIPLMLPAYRGGWLQRAYSALVSHTARRSSAILTVSHASKRDIVSQLAVEDAQMHVVHHGPNQVDKADKETGRQGDGEMGGFVGVKIKYQLPDRYFLYLGGFDVRKNVRSVLAAYQRYLALGGDVAVKLVIAGKLPAIHSAFAPDPRLLAQEVGFTDGSPLAAQLHFCGWVDEADKAALYAGATAFLFPSEYEGFGMMVIEAMSAGTPVVTSAK